MVAAISDFSFVVTYFPLFCYQSNSIESLLVFSEALGVSKSKGSGFNQLVIIGVIGSITPNWR